MEHKIDGKMFSFQGNLGMWPFKSIIVLKNEVLFTGL